MQDLKTAYQSAKKELDEEVKRELVEQMKGYIKDTLQAIEQVKGDIADKQQELKALKADLSDLESGKLDKIKERQDKDPVAKRVSVINITYIITNYPWIVPYVQPIYHYPVVATTTFGSTLTGTTNTLVATSNTAQLGTGGTNYLSANNTAYTASDVSGTYTVTTTNGSTKAFYI